MAFIERFGNYEIAQGADGQPIELQRSPDEFVFLAFDTRTGRLVELHVLKSGTRLWAPEKQSAFERSRQAAGIGHASFIRVLDSGEDADLVYYASSLNDGEPLEDYILRRGAFPPPTAFSLLIHLMDDLIHLQQLPRLLEGTRLDKPFITLQEETFLQLRVLDFGLSNPEQNLPPPEVAQRLVHELCRAAFLMLTGKVYAGEDCDRYSVIRGLPSNLRTLLRTTLADPSAAPTSITLVRDGIRDALTAQTRDIQGRTSRRHLVAVESMVPRSTLREALLQDVRLEQLLKGKLVPENAESQRYPFTFEASDARTQAPVTVHLLPPRRIVSSEHYDAVPLQMWRCTAESHPNILRSLSVWESPDLTFLTEERSTGFPLSRLIAERVYLNPSEVLLILRQVKAGLDQALECGMEKLDIHPCNIFLKITGKVMAREKDKLLQKRLDAWPKFVVMLRPHMTMRSLYEPLLLDVEGPAAEHSKVDSADFRNRSYVALAAYLLSGERQVAGQQRLPESLPEALSDYVTQCTTRARQSGRTPSPVEFLAEFEKCSASPNAASEAEEGSQTTSAPPRRTPPPATISRTSTPPVHKEVDDNEDEEADSVGLKMVPTAMPKPGRVGETMPAAAASRAPLDPEMESAGAISDFDEDNVSSDDGWDDTKMTSSYLGNPDPTVDWRDVVKRNRIGMIIGAVALFVIVCIVWAIFSGKSDNDRANEAAAVRTTSLLPAPPLTPSPTPVPVMVQFVSR
jgi:serine/threonine protein kinase